MRADRNLGARARHARGVGVAIRGSLRRPAHLAVAQLADAQLTAAPLAAHRKPRLLAPESAELCERAALRYR